MFFKPRSLTFASFSRILVDMEADGAFHERGVAREVPPAHRTQSSHRQSGVDFTKLQFGRKLFWQIFNLELRKNCIQKQ
jgi:hypothetical protein